MISQLFKKVTSQLQDCAAIKQGIRTQTEQQLLLVPQASAQSSESAETPPAQCVYLPRPNHTAVNGSFLGPIAFITQFQLKTLTYKPAKAALWLSTDNYIEGVAWKWNIEGSRLSHHVSTSATKKLQLMFFVKKQKSGCHSFFSS